RGPGGMTAGPSPVLGAILRLCCWPVARFLRGGFVLPEARFAGRHRRTWFRFAKVHDSLTVRSGASARPVLKIRAHGPAPLSGGRTENAGARENIVLRDRGIVLFNCQTADRTE